MKKNVTMLLLFFVLSLSGKLFANDWKNGFTLKTQNTQEFHIIHKSALTKKNSLILREPEFSADLYLQEATIVDAVAVLKSRKFWKGVLYGAAIGAASGAIIGYLFGNVGAEEDSGNWFDFRFTPGENALIGAIAGTFVGAIIGGIVGALK